MPKYQYTNTINKSQGSMSPLDSIYLITGGSEYPRPAEAQQKYLNINYMKMIQVLKEKMNKSLNERQESKKN